MRQGLPQGSVLAPILFLFFINNLAKILPESELISLFADDVSILVTDESKEEAAKRAQGVVDMVVEWSAKWKLTLNASKSEVSFFSVNTRTSEVEWKPVITINGEPLEFKPTPRLLGVTLDRQLTFGPQVEKVTKEAESKMRMIAMLANLEWGWPNDQLRMVYQTFIMSKLGYAGPSWHNGCKKQAKANWSEPTTKH